MEAVSFESLVQAFGAPVAMTVWILWHVIKRDKPVDAGSALMKDMARVIDKLDDQARRITVLEVKLDERTKRG